MKVSALQFGFKRRLKFVPFVGPLMMLIFTALSAQDVTVAGTVISSEDGNVISSVNVIIKGSRII